MKNRQYLGVVGGEGKTIKARGIRTALVWFGVEGLTEKLFEKRSEENERANH